MNEELLLKYNAGKYHAKIRLCKGCIIYKSNIKDFNGGVIRDILAFINAIHEKYKNVGIPILFEFGNIRFEDKLTYIFLEAICYILIKKYKHSVWINFGTTPQIFTEGIASSPLLLLKTKEKKPLKKNLQKFISKYKFDIYGKHYRRVLGYEEMQDEKLCRIMDEVRSFLKFSSVSEQCLDEITEVIIELIGNVSEHTVSECLIDIDVTSEYEKKEDVGLFRGINLSVLNFSDQLLSEQIKHRILSSDNLIGRYGQVKSAYQFHSQYFNDDYYEEDFYNIAAFQHKISGNIKKQITGGTGLTKLICSLEKRSDTHNCYVITGNRALFFRHELLEYNDDNWLGFNKEKDFLNHLPDQGVVGIDHIYMPGVAYNLNFAMKRE